MLLAIAISLRVALYNHPRSIVPFSARMDEFERSMSDGGRLREYALLMFTMRIRQLIVAVDKMDAENVWHSADRFSAIQDEVSTFVMKVGYRRK